MDSTPKCRHSELDAATSRVCTREISKPKDVATAEDEARRRSHLLELLRKKLQGSRSESAEKTPGIFVIAAEGLGSDGVGISSGGSRWPQYLAAFLATLVTVSGGSTMGWSAPALPLLEARLNHTVHPLTEVQTSWISSLLPLGALVGVLPAGYFADAVGRKRALLALVAPYLAGWLLVSIDVEKMPLIYAGRFISGICLGAGSVITPMYIEEIAEVSQRGILGVLYDVMVGIGILWSYAVGASTSYGWLVIACALLPITFAATFCWMPESPVHLVTSRGADAAEASLRWLRARANVLPELRQLEKDAGKHREAAARGHRSARPAAKAAGVVAGLMLFRQLSGVNAILFYAVAIFRSTGDSLSPTTSAVVVGAAQVAATVVSGILVDVVGRRILLGTSGAVSAVCHSVLAVYFHLRDAGASLDSLGWLPLSAVVVFIAAFNLGLGPLPWVISAELVPVSARAWAGPAAVSVNWLLVFVVTVCFAQLEAALGPTVVFASFGLACAASMTFVMLRVPETRGKTREEIQKMLAAARS